MSRAMQRRVDAAEGDGVGGGVGRGIGIAEF